MNTNLYRRPCILLAGGEGKRMGSETPKQYIDVLGRTIIGRTLQTIQRWSSLDSFVIVADESYRELLDKQVPGSISVAEYAFLGYVLPGASRQLSIKNAMEAIQDHMAEDAVVMVHDAVRPEVSRELFDRCDAMIGVGDGVMPYLEMKDTIYKCQDIRSEVDRQDGIILQDNINTKEATDKETTTEEATNPIAKRLVGNIDRNTIVAGQTPEFYDYWKYLAAFQKTSDSDLARIQGSTQLAVEAGMDIRLVPGEESNFKITTKEDLVRYKKVIEERLLSYEGVGSTPNK
ncbi:MAG: 2-C-methyl-D-erythritol 4-phosphate cytidylyltransferase [Eubacterium sp.]|nr:2-C-methyl-D-erythritol 4-phosphate cytidylyltransferase [Eubacterium sp.]